MDKIYFVSSHCMEGMVNILMQASSQSCISIIQIRLDIILYEQLKCESQKNTFSNYLPSNLWNAIDKNPNNNLHFISTRVRPGLRCCEAQGKRGPGGVPGGGSMWFQHGRDRPGTWSPPIRSPRRSLPCLCLRPALPQLTKTMFK